MFANRSGDSAALRDENSLSSSLKSSTKTPSQHKTPKRRAFGDISNRKQGNNNNNKDTLRKTPHVSIVPTTTHNKNKTTTVNHRNKKSGIVAPRTKSVTFAPTTATTTKKLAPPVEDVELSAGRTYSDQVSFFDQDDTDDDDTIKEILEEQAEWEQEMALLLQEERTRHARVRQEQINQAEKELQAKMQALWKQDEQDLAEADKLDHLVLQSVPSFDDLNLDKEGFGSYSFDDDGISF